MSVRFVFLPPNSDLIKRYVAGLEAANLGLDIVVCDNREDAVHALPGARAAFGFMDADLFSVASQLEWLSCPMAGPDPSFYFPELRASPVKVTNVRGIYSDHISEHIMAFVLCFARGMHRHFAHQFDGRWVSDGEADQAIYLPESTALIIGVGGIGAATARHCSYFGMHVVGIDPRVSSPPEGVDELLRPGDLNRSLAEADFVIVTAPQTPATQGLFDADRFAKMKKSAVFINIGRGANVMLTDLNEALRSGLLAGAALDVFEIEPLPEDHPLWTAPNFLMTPHVAAAGPFLTERRVDLLVENCRRFSRGEELMNVVDKENWF